MSGRCITCKHWVRICPHGNRAGQWCWDEDCAGAMASKRGFCLRADSEDGEPVDADALMWGVDASEYKAGVYTRPEFGCVMHEEREG